MSRYVHVPRPTEHAAIRACEQSPRPTLQIPAILADLITANRASDRRGVNLCAHLVARAALKKVGE
ncbi:hypothetical protein [Streptomyces sp. NBC_00140]|uniref:hypothetical protein n=1 Tax=Streptomyces sp. NBC_00140 TaxID=2975664 RepID=UPI002253D55D|nr:hypothetical protein [Streptomyces sp. NBC_00140]MCX5338116.1 hypothetical protein [Streptomyces sp. NBC_00140]